MSAENVSIPRVSAIITAYNSADFIRDAIESVLAQTSPVAEIVVVDDGSTDETAAIIQSYADRGVRYIFQENQGAGAARNRGVGETSGDLIAFLDGDDIWLPDKIGRQLDYLRRHPDVALVTGHKWRLDVESQTRRIERSGIGRWQDLQREIAVRNVVGNPSMVLLRRWVFDEIGFFSTDLRWGQDWQFWIRLARRLKIGFTDDLVIVYRWHPENLSQQHRLKRIACLFGISREAIKLIRPRWWQPILLARAWSRAELYRAHYAIGRQHPRHVIFRHSICALVSYPFEDTAVKLAAVFRSAVGDRRFLRMKDELRRLRAARRPAQFKR